jgi:hypothetical protein
MPPVGFEPTISVLERTKTVHALDLHNFTITTRIPAVVMCPVLHSVNYFNDAVLHDFKSKCNKNESIQIHIKNENIV